MLAWPDVVLRAERWLLPAECATCAQPVHEPDEPLVCAVCRARWRTVPLPQCPTCGEHAPLGLACRVCSDWPPDFAPVRSAVRLDPSVRPLLHRFKYSGWSRLADAFAVRMGPLLCDLGDADLVPIPLARKRLRVRGYNQAERLATSLSDLTGMPLALDRLVRARETPTQTRLAPEARRANLAEAFECPPSGRAAVLVDDVFTTGATLCSAAAALLDAGAVRVAAVTFARAELPLTAVVGRKS